MELLIALSSALWLGIMTSLSPCPLATNIAAVSFISKKITHPWLVFISGLAYTCGRMAAYALLGWAIIGSLLGVPQSAQFLQKFMPRVLGPLLITTGLFLLEVFSLRLPGMALSQERQHKLVESGAVGAFILGAVFALAFCPVSAALFFGSLIPLALDNKAGALLPFVYGLGTGVPVLICSVAVAFGVTSLGRWFNSLSAFEQYGRRITGALFIVIGIYYSFLYLIKL